MYLKYAIFLDCKQGRMVVPCLCSGQPIGPLKMETLGCLETSVKEYNSTMRKIAEERRFHLHYDKILKSRITYLCMLFKKDVCYNNEAFFSSTNSIKKEAKILFTRTVFNRFAFSVCS